MMTTIERGFIGVNLGQLKLSFRKQLMTMISKMALGQAVKLARHAARMSQDDLALVTSRSFISAVERGVKSPTIDKLAEIAGAMKMNPATIAVIATALASNRKSASILREVAEQTAMIAAAAQTFTTTKRSLSI